MRATYGSLTRSGRSWEMTGVPPHVAIRLKATFADVPKAATGTFFFADTDETCTDLDWFLSRYPMEVSAKDREHMLDRRRAYEDGRNEIEEILNPEWRPPERFGFRPGQALRHEQAQAVEILHRKKRLLVLDDVGKGKTVTALGALAASEYLPAAIVADAHMPSQWAEFIARFTYMSSHIVKGTVPYSLPPANIYLFRYTNIAGWVDVAETGLFRSVIFDEVQSLRRGGTAQKGKAAEVFARKAGMLAGLSVGPETVVELVGANFGSGWVGSIEDAWDQCATLGEIRQEGSYQIIDLPHGLRTRGWVNGGWGWKPVLRLIRHVCDRSFHSLRAAGRDLTVTEDHSIFVVEKNGFSERLSSQIAVGDVLLADDGAGWEIAEERMFDVESMLSQISRVQAVVDLSSTNRRALGLSPQEWQNCHKEATYGPRLPLAVYQKFRPILPEATGFYVGRGKAPYLPTRIKLSDYAYLFGFYLGDGWVSNSQCVSFAVENDRVSLFCDRLREYRIGLKPTIKRSRGASYEVKCNHRLFAQLLSEIFGYVKCYEKRIPSEWIFSWPREAKLDLIQGLIDSDGYASERDRGRFSHFYTTTSRQLADDLVVLLRSLGVVGGCHTRQPAEGGCIDGRRIRAGRPNFQVYWSAHQLFGNRIGNRGQRHRFKWTKGCSAEAIVRSNTRIPAPVHVYDFEVAGHPSFSGNGLLVHNSATMIYNYGDEAFHIVNLIAPGALGDWPDFLREWCTSDGRHWLVKDPDALGSYLRELQLVVRRLRDGRPVNKHVVEVEVDDEEVADQEELAIKLAMKVVSGSFTERGQAARELDALSRHMTGVAKAKSVAAYVRMMLKAGTPILLTGWHRSVYDIWLEELRDFNPMLYTGTESPGQKDRTKHAFVKGDTDLCIMSLRSGVGLDGLQKRCHTVVFGELDWTPQIHEQVIGRLDREGQPAESIDAIYAWANFGSDPTVMSVHGVKGNQARGILDPEKEVMIVQADPTRMKRLAQSFLDRRGV